MKEGTLPWLLKQEIRLWWRELRGKWFFITMALLTGVLMGGLVILWLAVFSNFDDAPQLQLLDPLPETILWGAVVGWLFCLFFASIQAMGQCLIALFDRGDLDLLVSSPVSSKVIFASRLLGVALEIFLGISAYIILPTFIAVLAGFIRLLGIFPALMALSLMATCLAMLITLWLVRWMGARQARLWNQVLASLLGVLFFLSTQAPNLMASTDSPSGQFWTSLTSLFQTGNILGAESWIWFPARAIFFDLSAVALTLLTSGALLWVTVETLHRTFIDGTQQSLTLKQGKRPPQPVTRFNGSLSRVVLLKEWRAIARNPHLLSQTFFSMLFLIPLLVMTLRGDEGSAIALIK